MDQNPRILYIIFILLLVLSVGAYIYFWKKSSDAGLENTQLTVSVQSLEAEKLIIEHDLDSLSLSYSNLRTENEDLRGKEASTASLIAQKDADQGDQHLYLAITDEKGQPIAAKNLIKTTVETPSGPVSLVAQQVKAVSLGETQRLSFTYKLDERLKRGNYVAAIYCNVGLLGPSSFHLN